MDVGIIVPVFGCGPVAVLIAAAVYVGVAFARVVALTGAPPLAGRA
jgi:hypothetical protein